MKQQARELTNCEDGFLKDKEYLFMDADGAFCPAFREMLSQGRGANGLATKSETIKGWTTRSSNRV